MWGCDSGVNVRAYLVLLYWSCQVWSVWAVHCDVGMRCWGECTLSVCVSLWKVVKLVYIGMWGWIIVH
jgi:hypothetical protein